MWSRAYAFACVSFALTTAVVVQTGKTEPLIDAVRKGDAAEVRRLLDAGANPNTRETLISKPSLEDRQEGGKPYQGDTALMIAVSRNRLSMVKLLLERAADVNLPGLYGYTPLMEARDVSVAKLLLSKGARPNARAVNGLTPLDRAANSDNHALVKLLIGHGANVNGGSGQPPLVVAAQNGQVEMVRLLVKHGADVNLRRGGLSALEASRNQGGSGMALEPEIEAIILKAGGKGRSRAALEKEKQRQMAAWAAQRKSATAAGKDQTLTDDDRQIIEVALLDMLSNKGDDLHLYGDKGATKFVLIDRTARGPGAITDSQINVDLDESQANDVLLEMRQHLAERNTAQVSLSEFKPLSAAIVVRSENDRQSWMLGRGPKDARGWAQIFLPGYSKARDRAVLRFWMGPTAHGGTGTYLLIKENGRWRVKWRKFSFYV